MRARPERHKNQCCHENAEGWKNTETPFSPSARPSPCKGALPEIVGRQLVLNLHDRRLYDSVA